jgi:hypothetical protein
VLVVVIFFISCLFWAGITDKFESNLINDISTSSEKAPPGRPGGAGVFVEV